MLTVTRSWLDVARAAALDALYRGRSVLCLGSGGGELPALLLERGARSVVAVEADPAARAHATARLDETRRRADLRSDLPPPGGARFDVVMVSALERLGVERLDELARRVATGGWLIAAAPPSELGYYALHDALAPHFPTVTMLGQSALVGAALAPFGEEEVEPTLDASLLPVGDPTLYVAIAGPARFAAGYGLVLLPEEARAHENDRARLAPPVVDDRATVAALDALRRDHQRLAAEHERVAAARSELDARLAEEVAERRDLEARITVRERGFEELSRAALTHGREMQSLRTAMSERDAYIAELETSVRAVDKVNEELRRATTRAHELETQGSAAKRRVAELEGELAKAAAAIPSVVIAPEQLHKLEQQVAEAAAALAKQKTRADDLQREAWAHMKARSETEASAAELREDTVRKLKDARKIANLELMRAMEEATKKAVKLKEELTRCERERNEAQAALKKVVAERAAERPPWSVRGDVERIEGDLERELARVVAIEEGLARMAAAAASERERRARALIHPLAASDAEWASAGVRAREAVTSTPLTSPPDEPTPAGAAPSSEAAPAPVDELSSNLTTSPSAAQPPSEHDSSSQLTTPPSEPAPSSEPPVSGELTSAPSEAAVTGEVESSSVLTAAPGEPPPASEPESSSNLTTAAPAEVVVANEAAPVSAAPPSSDAAPASDVIAVGEGVSSISLTSPATDAAPSGDVAPHEEVPS